MMKLTSDRTLRITLPKTGPSGRVPPAIVKSDPPENGGCRPFRSLACPLLSLADLHRLRTAGRDSLIWHHASLLHALRG